MIKGNNVKREIEEGRKEAKNDRQLEIPRKPKGCIKMKIHIYFPLGSSKSRIGPARMWRHEWISP